MAARVHHKSSAPALTSLEDKHLTSLATTGTAKYRKHDLSLGSLLSDKNNKDFSPLVDKINNSIGKSIGKMKTNLGTDNQKFLKNQADAKQALKNLHEVSPTHP